MTQAELTEISRFTHDLVETATGAQRKAIEQIEKRLRESGTSPRGGFGAEDSLGTLFTASKEYRSIASGDSATVKWTHEGKAVGNVVLGPLPDTIAPYAYVAPALLPQFGAVMRALVPSRATASEAIQAVHEEGSEGEAGIQAGEGGAKTQIDMKFVSEFFKLSTFNAYTKVSTQALQDAGWIEDAIVNNILRKIEKKEDNTWVAELLAAAPVDGTTPGTDDTALDVISAAQDALAAAGWTVSGTVVNVLDLGKIRRLKDANKNYIAAPGWLGKVVGTPFVPAGKFVTGAFSTAASILDRDTTIVINQGTTNDDFIKNLRVLLGERRSGLWIAQPAGFLQGTLPAWSAAPLTSSDQAPGRTVKR